jgi:hypothetical protein
MGSLRIQCRWSHRRCHRGLASPRRQNCRTGKRSVDRPERQRRPCRSDATAIVGGCYRVQERLRCVLGAARVALRQYLFASSTSAAPSTPVVLQKSLPRAIAHGGAASCRAWCSNEAGMKLNVPHGETNCLLHEIARKGDPGTSGTPPIAIGIDMTELVAVLSRSLSQRDDLKEIILFCAAGLLLSLVMIHYGVDLGSTP